MALKLLDVPRRQRRRTQQYTSAHCQRSIELCDLSGSGSRASIKPVHAVHDNSNSQSTRGDACNNLFQLIGLSLLVEGLGLKKLLHSLSKTEDSSNPTEDTNGVARTTSIIETITAAVLENMDVLEPVLECTTRKMRRELSNEQLAEVRVFAISKDFPKVFVWKSSVRSCLEFEEMILSGVQINSMNSGGTLQEHPASTGVRRHECPPK
ncbi:hypothetical protein HG530_004221 [Fusarium avenaceum]|nr:hypothetical protein HG530_004221 [Fusarium avenaceum]